MTTADIQVRQQPGSNRIRVLPNINDRAIFISGHAATAMAARQIGPDVVHDMLRNYENRWSSLHYNGTITPDTYVYQGGELGIVVFESSSMFLVKTVLLRSPDQWNDEQARERLNQ